MKKIFLLIFLFSFIFSCKKNNLNSDLKSNEYAINFSIKKDNNQTKIISAGKELILPFKFKLKRCIVTTNSAVAYIDALGEFNTIVGVCSPKYYYNPKIERGIKSGKIQDIGNESYLDFEKILALKPDIIITTNSTPSHQRILEKLSKLGIKILFVEEYMETHSLGKTEYLKLYGILYNKEAQALTLYTKIKNNYLKLKQLVAKTKDRPSVFTSIMYGDVWYMAGGASFMSSLFKDAGANYLWGNNDQKGTLNLSFEEVFSKAANADFWIGASNFSSKKDLLNSNSYYQEFLAYKKDHIYAMNNRENINKINDYFETGSINADQVLADIIKILHPNILLNHQLIYLKKIN